MNFQPSFKTLQIFRVPDMLWKSEIPLVRKTSDHSFSLQSPKSVKRLLSLGERFESGWVTLEVTLNRES